MNYIVYVDAPPYPRQGYYLGARRYPKSDEGKMAVFDSLPATLVDHVIVTADNIEKARAIGLRQMFEKARRESREP